MAKKKMKLNVVETGTQILGGFAGDQATNYIDNMLSKSNSPDMAKYSSLGTLAVGILGSMFAGDKLKPFFMGMTVVGGTESVESLVKKAVAPTTAPVAVEGLRSDEIPGVNVRNIGTGTVNAGETGYANYGY